MSSNILFHQKIKSPTFLHTKEPPFMLQVLSYYAFWEYSFYAKIFTYYVSPLTHYAQIMLDLKLKKQMSYQLRSTQKTKK